MYNGATYRDSKSGVTGVYTLEGLYLHEVGGHVFFAGISGGKAAGRHGKNFYELLVELSEKTGVPVNATDIFALESFNSECFLSSTPIQMWPLTLSLTQNPDGTYDEASVLSQVWTKPIEEIEAGDLVLSYDKEGRLQPGRVTRTFRNTATHILDFWGTGVTPGHAYLCVEGHFAGQHVPLMDILRTDGVIERADGTHVRAATGCELGSSGDRILHVVFGKTLANGKVKVSDHAIMRAGTRVILANGRDATLEELIKENGGVITNEGYVRSVRTGAETPFRWTFSDALPKPEDYILQRSQVDLDAIYLAGEWEQIGTQMAPPVGALASGLGAPLAARPAPNIPPAFADHPDAPALRPAEQLN